MTKARIAVVGCGYWGQKLIRTFGGLTDVQLKGVCDFDPVALARVKRRYPTVRLFTEYEDLLSESQIDAIVLATPISTHFPFASKALRACKHVLVEKPIATSSEEALQLIELARKSAKCLMVDHTFMYAPAVRQIKSMFISGELTELLYYDSVRISLGLVQSDTNVLWDLGGHDFSIIDYLCAPNPLSVCAIGTRHFSSPFETIAYTSVRFNNNVLAHSHLNWLSPVKLRRILIGTNKHLIVYDDMEVSDKLKIYDNTITYYHDVRERERLLSSYQNGGMFAPRLETTEPLHLMASDFVHAIIEQRPPVSDGYAGYRVVRLLEAAQRSLTRSGQPVDLCPCVTS